MNENEPMMSMPKYKSHKSVWALKIESVESVPSPENQEDSGERILTFEDKRYAPITVDYAYVSKHKPQAGGYYVVYEGGYKSWSPADAFESGYTLID